MKKKLSKLQFLNKLGSLFLGGLFIWGLLFAGWSSIMVVAGYLVEEVFTFILTGITLLFLKISGRKPVFLKKFLLVLGLFLILHTVFLLILAGAASERDPMALAVFEMMFYPIAGGAIKLNPALISSLSNIAVVALLSILYSLYRSVFYKGKWKTMDVTELVNRSFGAFIAPHFVILFGVGAIIFTNTPDSLAVILVLVKVFIDLTGFGAKGSRIVQNTE